MSQVEYGSIQRGTVVHLHACCGKCGERGHRSGDCTEKGLASASRAQRAAKVLDSSCAVVLH